MFRDPFGDWDWDFILQIGLMIAFIFAFITMIAVTEGNWYDPYVYVYDFILANSPFSSYQSWFHSWLYGGMNNLEEDFYERR